MTIPLYGFLQGDVLGLLILAEEHETVHALSERLQEAASVRVARTQNVRVIYKGNVLDPGLTLREAGLNNLERFGVVRS
jgi:Toluene-4-monooxygenase system protein B (TmoB)